MSTPTKGPRFGGSPAHERLLLANLATQLFEHGRIKTTEAKARRLRPVAEKLITKARRNDDHAFRQVKAALRTRTEADKEVVYRLFTEIAPRYVNRPGGYTRIVKIGNRKGDNAPMAIIELVEELTVAQEAVGEAEGATRRAVKEAATKKTTAADEVGETETDEVDDVVDEVEDDEVAEADEADDTVEESAAEDAEDDKS